MFLHFSCGLIVFSPTPKIGPLKKHHQKDKGYQRRASRTWKNTLETSVVKIETSISVETTLEKIIIFDRYMVRIFNSFDDKPWLEVDKTWRPIWKHTGDVTFFSGIS